MPLVGQGGSGGDCASLPVRKEASPVQAKGAKKNKAAPMPKAW